MLAAKWWKITFYDAGDMIVCVMTARRFTKPMTYADAKNAADAEMVDGLDCPGAVRYELEPLEGKL